jgi:hypothetical protein
MEQQHYGGNDGNGWRNSNGKLAMAMDGTTTTVMEGVTTMRWQQ